MRLIKQALNPLDNIKLFNAPNPELGLELANIHRPDIVILDINLPGINGFEVLKKLKSDNNTRDIPVIAVSANAMPEDINNALELGFDHYVTKPINVKKLIDLIEKTITHNKKIAF